MLYGGGAALLVQLALVVYCALNVITTPEDQVRNLPKLLWLALVVLIPVVGPVTWLVAGRPRGRPRSLPTRGSAGLPPTSPRPARPSATAPDDDEAFLRRLRERAEEQRRAGRERPPAEPDA